MILEEHGYRFVRFMERVGHEKLIYRDGLLVSPGCNGDYVQCSARFDLDLLSDLIKEFLEKQNRPERIEHESISIK